jgi:hypothetical protein
MKTLLPISRAFSVGGAAASFTAAPTAQPSPPVVAFNADWSISLSAPLVAGEEAILRYDTNRLPRCRATYESVPAWAILARLQADGSTIVSNLVVANGSQTDNPVDVPFTVPYSAGFAIWFENSDESGCTAWDSDYGANFHFAVQGPPTLHFRTDWTQQVAGALRAGQTFAVDYDVSRLPTCRGTNNGKDAWGVEVFYRFDDGTTGSTSVVQGIGTYAEGPAPAVLTAPPGVQQVEMWFQNTDVDGCVAYDSDFGKNYSFSLQ